MDSFSPLIGQPQAVELLRQAVSQNRVAPAYLFVGTEGIGRGLAARCFVEHLFCRDGTAEFTRNRLQTGNHPDFLWVQPTYQYQGELFTPNQAVEKGIKRKAPPIIRLEQIRAITEFLSRPPLSAPRNVVILSEAETMAEAAANALLKTLEEPGRLATLILIAPTPDSILPTLVSRCQKIPFYRLNAQAIARVLTQTGHAEILQQPTILSLAAGSPGSAIAALKQLQNIPSDLLQAATQLPLTYRDALELAKNIDKTLDTDSQLWLVDYLQQSYWQRSFPVNIIQQLESARQALQSYAQPRLVWECTFLSFVNS